jgi:hypothetical protein
MEGIVVIEAEKVMLRREDRYLPVLLGRDKEEINDKKLLLLWKRVK